VLTWLSNLHLVHKKAKRIIIIIIIISRVPILRCSRKNSCSNNHGNRSMEKIEWKKLSESKNKTWQKETVSVLIISICLSSHFSPSPIVLIKQSPENKGRQTLAPEKVPPLGTFPAGDAAEIPFFCSSPKGREQQ